MPDPLESVWCSGGIMWQVYRKKLTVCVQVERGAWIEYIRGEAKRRVTRA